MANFFDTLTSPVTAPFKAYASIPQAIEDQQKLRQFQIQAAEQNVSQQELAPLFSILKDKNISRDVKSQAAQAIMQHPSIQKLVQLRGGENMIQNPYQDAIDAMGKITGSGQPQGGADLFGKVVGGQPSAMPPFAPPSMTIDETGASFKLNPLKPDFMDFMTPTGQVNKMAVNPYNPSQKTQVGVQSVPQPTVRSEVDEKGNTVDTFRNPYTGEVVAKGGISKQMEYGAQYTSQTTGGFYLLGDDGILYQQDGTALKQVPSDQIPKDLVKTGTESTNVSVKTVNEQKVPVYADPLEASRKAEEYNQQDPSNLYTAKYQSSLGGYVIEPEKRKPPASTQQDTRVKVERLKRIVSDIKNSVDYSKTGPIQGNINKLKTATVGDTYGGKMASLYTQLLERLYAISGKQLSEGEMAKWLPMFPSQIMPDKTHEAVLDEFIRAVAEDQEISESVLKKAGVLSGGSGKSVEVPKIKTAVNPETGEKLQWDEESMSWQKIQ